jgi:hypothetical protein
LAPMWTFKVWPRGKPLTDNLSLGILTMSVWGRFCCKSRPQRIRAVVKPFVESRVLIRSPLRFLRNSDATHCTEPEWWRSRDQRCEPPQVLGDGGENKLIQGTLRATQSEPTEPQDALEARERRLNLLPFSSRPVEPIGANEGPLREKVPPSRFDLSNTGICGAMPFSSTSSLRTSLLRPLKSPRSTPQTSEQAAAAASAEHCGVSRWLLS